MSSLSILDFKFFSTTSEVTIAVVSALVSILLCIIVSRNRRRRKLPPGPKGIPLLGYLPFLGLEPHKTLWKLREKYGGLIGLYMGRKYTVTINEYSLMKEILGHPGSLDRAPHLFDNIPHTGFITLSGDAWIEQRRFCIFATKNLGLGTGSWEDDMMEEVSNFKRRIQAFNGRPVLIDADLTASVTANIISLLIGRRLKEDEIQLVVDYTDVVLTSMGPLMITTLVPGLRKFFEVFKIAGFDKILQIQDTFYDFIGKEVQRHKLSHQSDKDFIDIYLKKLSELSKGNTKHYFSETMLKGNVNVLLLGASDTVTASLGWMFRIMAKHKDIQNKVYTELMEVVGKEGRARYMERQKFPYTFAVVMESMRYSTIGPLSATRRANQDIPIKDFIIPKGSEITSNIWAMHNDQTYWKEPEKFKPERFLKDKSTDLIRHPPSFVPFSYGRRNCPGQSIAWMEILFYFSEIVKNFEISAPLGSEPEFKIVSGFVSRLEPQELCFKER